VFRQATPGVAHQRADDLLDLLVGVALLARHVVRPESGSVAMDEKFQPDTASLLHIVRERADRSPLGLSRALVPQGAEEANLMVREHWIREEPPGQRVGPKPGNENLHHAQRLPRPTA
jgi:hypothetical protein